MTRQNDPRADDLVEEFSFFDDFEERYSHVIALGRDLEAYPDAFRDDAHRVQGCASQVWLHIENDDTGRLVIAGDSDAFIVKGLVALLIRLYSGRPADEIIALDIDAIFSDLGLDGQLTAQRANGLRSMVNLIRERAFSEIAART